VHRAAGATSYIHLCDWYATFCGLAGVDPRDVVAEEHKLPAVVRTHTRIQTHGHAMSVTPARARS
jgi:arylsulfatase A-like enzyme